ncbi:MAG: cyclic nucleotide-binding domain-containing protein [Neptuniibacter sp.]
MDTIDVNEVLEHSKLADFTHHSVFGALPEKEILWLLKHGEIFHLKPGSILFLNGDRGDSFFVILSGSLEYSKYHEGHYAYIRDYAEGEQIGFVSMIALHDRVGKAISPKESIILKVDSQLFHEFHQHAPIEFGILLMNLARDMARSFRQVNNLIVELSRSCPPVS